jgi:transposase
MAKPYSYDLRCKVMAAIEQDGMKRCEASTVFQISRNTINYPATWARTSH